MAAVRIHGNRHPPRVKPSAPALFSHSVTTHSAAAGLLPGRKLQSGGLVYSAAVVDADSEYLYILAGARKPHELPRLLRMDAPSANLMTDDDSRRLAR